MKREYRQKIDRLFHTLESKGYECVFSDVGITVRTPRSVITDYRFETGISRDRALLNTAKFLAHRHGVRFNAPFGAEDAT